MDFQAQYTKERKDRLSAAGLCTACGKSPARPGRRLCQQCSDSRAAQHAELYARRKEAGICTRCGEAPARPGKTMCAACAERSREYQRRRMKATPECGGDCESCPLPECAGRMTFGDRWQARHARAYDSAKASGLCVACRKRPALPGIVKCGECQKRESGLQKGRYDRLKGAGLCVQCGQRPALPGRVRCHACAEKLVERARTQCDRRRAAGLCTVCGKAPARPGVSTCGACGEARAAYQRAKRMVAPKAGYRIDPYGKKRVREREAGGNGNGQRRES